MRTYFKHIRIVTYQEKGMEAAIKMKRGGGGDMKSNKIRYVSVIICYELGI